MTVAGSQLQIHAAHLVLFGVWLVVFGFVYLRERLRGRAARSGPAGWDESVDVSPPLYRPFLARLLGLPGAIAGCSLIAGAVHLDVIGQHFAESALYGTFFLVLTIVQFVFAVAVVWRPTRALLLAGASASFAVVLLWFATRTTGIPLGPAAGRTEPFGQLDLAASAAELGLVVLCGFALRIRTVRRRPVSTGRAPRLVPLEPVSARVGVRVTADDGDPRTRARHA